MALSSFVMSSSLCIFTSSSLTSISTTPLVILRPLLWPANFLFIMMIMVILKPMIIITSSRPRNEDSPIMIDSSCDMLDEAVDEIVDGVGV